MKLMLLILVSFAAIANSFQIHRYGIRKQSAVLKMTDLNSIDTNTYIAIFTATMIPSLALVKFVGDQADTSRGSLSDRQREKFKKNMMDTQGANFGIPSSEEEILKKQIAKAYMQDKDVDVAVLEEKLRQRVQWRKEMMAQSKTGGGGGEDEDGW